MIYINLLVFFMILDKDLLSNKIFYDLGAFNCLPNELIFHVVKQLNDDFNALNNLKNTSHYFRDLILNANIISDSHFINFKFISFLKSHDKSNFFNNIFSIYGRVISDLKFNFYDFISHKDINLVIKDNLAIQIACKYGYIEIVEKLLKDEKVDPTANNQYAVREASKKGHTEVVKLLLENNKVDPSVEYNDAIIQASKNGHEKVVMLLLKDSRIETSAESCFNPIQHLSVRLEYAFILASIYGHRGVVKLFLEDVRINPAAKDNEAIRCASKNGHDKVVKLLIKDVRVNPAAKENEAIRCASEYGYEEIVKLLLNHNKVDPCARNNEAIIEAST